MTFDDVVEHVAVVQREGRRKALRRLDRPFRIAGEEAAADREAERILGQGSPSCRSSAKGWRLPTRM